ncbi:von Willebrand factor A domain-containing protein 5A [Apodemus speciosus]|uniref:von Willebrand factor A domain-containing protein 5A n=1 Tax=Apodemus speciosus TaxID=105296 RepID=A0ABQ0F453_APOSI
MCRKLPLERDGALRYLLPAILNPRYQLTNPNILLEDLPYTLSMVATITSQHAIERVKSNCSLSTIQYLTENKTSAQVSLTEGHKFDRDVELLIYYSEVHSPSVAVEMGMLDMKPDNLMGAPCAMLSFYPDIPEVEASKFCGEFVFLMDRSGSMDFPMSRERNSQLRIEAAKRRVKYTQETMEDAVERVKCLEADLGGTEILAPLCNIFKAPSIPGHPLKLFVFTDGEVSDTFSVIKEVQLNSNKHRCFSFGIGQGASTSLIKTIARVSGGTAEFITGKDRMQTKALGSLKFALQCAVENISLSWELPPGLTVKMLSPEQPAIIRGQRLITYVQLTGLMPQVESTGTVCIKHSLQGKSLENRVIFSLPPKANANFFIHRLAAKSLIQTKDMGLVKTSEEDKEDVMNISLQSGVLSSFTAFCAINKELNKPVQGPLDHRVIPTTGIDVTVSWPPHFGAWQGQVEQWVLGAAECGSESINSLELVSEYSGMTNVAPIEETKEADASTKESNVQNEHKAFGDNVVVQLIALQNANGSWNLDEDLTKILGSTLKDIKAANPVKHEDPSAWATVLAVVWLHAIGKDLKCEWELLERKAVAWLHDHAVS